VNFGRFRSVELDGDAVPAIRTAMICISRMGTDELLERGSETLGADIETSSRTS
jgi:hypothetical protein